jgi:hypothetical protein
MGTIDKHDIGLNLVFILIVNCIDEIIDEGPFSSTGTPMKNEMGDFTGYDKMM